MRINRFIILLIIALYTISCDHVNYQQGKILYDTNCSTCHMKDGSGVAKLYPALNKFDRSQIDIEMLPCIIRYGQNKDKYSLEMVGIKSLTSIEINNIINYILNDMNQLNVEYRIDQTRAQLDNCQGIE